MSEAFKRCGSSLSLRDLNVLDNYHLVSNIPFLIKIFEMMVQDQLQSILQEAEKALIGSTD